MSVVQWAAAMSNKLCYNRTVLVDNSA